MTPLTAYLHSIITKDDVQKKISVYTNDPRTHRELPGKYNNVKHTDVEIEIDLRDNPDKDIKDVIDDMTVEANIDWYTHAHIKKMGPFTIIKLLLYSFIGIIGFGLISLLIRSL